MQGVRFDSIRLGREGGVCRVRVDGNGELKHLWKFKKKNFFFFFFGGGGGGRVVGGASG